MPGLAFTHLLGTAMVVADVRHAVDDLFAVELQHDAERTMRGRMIGAEIEEHEVLVVGALLHAPIFGLEQQRFLIERSEEHTSELQSLMRISYAVFCLKKKTTKRTHTFRASYT